MAVQHSKRNTLVIISLFITTEMIFGYKNKKATDWFSHLILLTYIGHWQQNSSYYVCLKPIIKSFFLLCSFLSLLLFFPCFLSFSLLCGLGKIVSTCWYWRLIISLILCTCYWLIAQYVVASKRMMRALHSFEDKELFFCWSCSTYKSVVGMNKQNAVIIN